MEPAGENGLFAFPNTVAQAGRHGVNGGGEARLGEAFEETVPAAIGPDPAGDADEGELAEAAIEEVFGGEAGSTAGIGGDFAEARERVARLELGIGEIERDRWEAAREDGMSDLVVLDAGDDAGASPGAHAGEHLLEVAGRHVKTPGPVQAGVADNAAEQIAAVSASGFNEECDAGHALQSSSSRREHSRDEGMRRGATRNLAGWPHAQL